MAGAPSFSQPYLGMQTPLQSAPKIRSSTSVSFYIPIPPLLVWKIILTNPKNIPFLYISALFHLPIFAYNHPNNLHPKYFPYLSHLANSGYVKGPENERVFWGLIKF